MFSKKVASIGLKHQECDHGRGAEKAPMRYAPEWDPVQEALELKPESLKCTHTDRSETQVMIWSGHGTNEHFLLHVNKAYSGYFIFMVTYGQFPEMVKRPTGYIHNFHPS